MNYLVWIQMNSKNLLQNVYRKFFQKMSFGYGFGKNPLIKKILKNCCG